MNKLIFIVAFRIIIISMITNPILSQLVPYNYGLEVDSLDVLLLGRIDTKVGDDNVYIGRNAGLSHNSSSIGRRNTFVGVDAGQLNTFASFNTFIGWRAGSRNSNAETSGSSLNTFVGAQAGQRNFSGSLNTFIGVDACFNCESGKENVVVGGGAASKNTSGDRNVIVGMGAGQNLETGANNVILGALTGFNSVNGEGNVFIGSNAGFNETESNRLYIENSDSNEFDNSNPLIYGEFDNNKVAINGSLKITDVLNLKKTTEPTGTCTDGDVYMDDGSGRVDTEIGLRYCDGGSWTDL